MTALSVWRKFASSPVFISINGPRLGTMTAVAREGL